MVNQLSFSQDGATLDLSPVPELQGCLEDVREDDYKYDVNGVTMQLIECLTNTCGCTYVAGTFTWDDFIIDVATKHQNHHQPYTEEELEALIDELADIAYTKSRREAVMRKMKNSTSSAVGGVALVAKPQPAVMAPTQPPPMGEGAGLYSSVLLAHSPPGSGAVVPHQVFATLTVDARLAAMHDMGVFRAGLFVEHTRECTNPDCSSKIPIRSTYCAVCGGSDKSLLWVCANCNMAQSIFDRKGARPDTMFCRFRWGGCGGQRMVKAKLDSKAEASVIRQVQFRNEFKANGEVKVPKVSFFISKSN